MSDPLVGSQMVPAAAHSPSVTDLTAWHIELLRTTSIFAERVVAPPWSASTDRLRTILLTISAFLSLSLAGIELTGDGFIAQLGKLATIVPLHIAATAFLVYALVAYFLAGSADIAVHKILIAGPHAARHAAKLDIQKQIEGRKSQQRQNQKMKRGVGKGQACNLQFSTC